MYTLESLLPDCVGRYISSERNASSVHLAALINGRTYAKVWQALVYWIVTQYEAGNSTSIAPIGVIVRTPAVGESVEGSVKGARFHFFHAFLTEYGLSTRSGHDEALREDDVSCIRPNLSTLSRLANVDPSTFRLALSHIFRRLGEVLAEREQVLIDCSVGSIVGDKACVDFLFHQNTPEEAKQTSSSSSSSDPRLLSRGGRWRSSSSSSTRVGARSSFSHLLLGDTKALRQRYPLKEESNGAAGRRQHDDGGGDASSLSTLSAQGITRIIDETGHERFIDVRNNQELDPMFVQQLLERQHQQATGQNKEEESKESNSFFSTSSSSGMDRMKKGRTTNGSQLARLMVNDHDHHQTFASASSQLMVARADLGAGSSSSSAEPVGIQRKLQGKEPLRNVRKLLGNTVRPELGAATTTAAAIETSQPHLLTSTPDKRIVGRATRFSSPSIHATPPGLVRTLVAGGPSPSPSSSAAPANLPPVLDQFARTRAACFTSESFYNSTSSKIALFYTPEAGAWNIVKPGTSGTGASDGNQHGHGHVSAASPALVHSGHVPFIMHRMELSEGQKKIEAQRRWKHMKVACETVEQRPTAGELSLSAQIIMLGIGDGRTAFSTSVPLTPLDSRMLSKSLLRYMVYIDSALPNSVVAPMSELWIRNGLSLLRTRVDDGLLSEAEVEQIVRSNLEEIKAGYIRSMKMAILDYVLRNDSERKRLSIPIPPPLPRPDWGASSPIAQAPLSWRLPIQRSYRYLSRHLYTNNPAMLALQSIWSKYEHLRLIELPPADQLPLSIRTFESMQKLARERTMNTLMQQWGDEVEFIFATYARDEALTDENSKDFFEAVATVMQQQVRSIVEKSVEELWSYFNNYQETPTIQFGTKENGMDDNDNAATTTNAGQKTIQSLTTIINPTWIRDEVSIATGTVSSIKNNPRPIFIQKLLLHKLKDGVNMNTGNSNSNSNSNNHSNSNSNQSNANPNPNQVSYRIDYDTPLSEVLKSMQRIFDDLFSVLQDIPRVENKIFSILDETRYLQLSLDGEGGAVLNKMKNEVLNVVSRGIEESQMLLSLYDEYTFLLDEEHRVSAFLKSPHSLQDYESEILRYRHTSIRLARGTHPRVRTGAFMCDCGMVNEFLVNKSQELSKSIGNFLATRTIDKNIHLCERFKSVSTTLLKKPTSTPELVELVRYASHFKKQDREVLMADCANVREQLRFLYKMDHGVGSDLLSHVGATWSWLNRIDSIIAESESMLSTERSKMEAKVEEARDTLHKQLASYAATVKSFEGMADVKKLNEYDTAIHELNRLLNKAEEEIEALHVQEELLGLTQTDFYMLNQTKSALQPYETLWSLVARWEKKKIEWIKGPVFKLDATQVETEVDEMYRTSFKLAQLLGETAPTVSKVAEDLKKGLSSFKPHVPLLHILCNTGMRERHWATVSDIIQFELRPDAHTPLNRILEMSVEQHLDALSEVSEAASKEQAIEKAVIQMKAEWKDMELGVKKWRETGTYILLGDSIEEIQTLLDDHLVKTQTARGSPFARPFIDEIREWESWLSHTQAIIEVWLKVQAAWVWLQPVFSAEDIMRQMPAEGSMFKVVDANWHKLMQEVVQDTKVFAVSVLPHILPILQEAQSLLDTIQAGLNHYLETKRLFFPRFYFLSNDELLEILSETRDPLRVQPHLKKVFEGVNELEFNTDTMDILAMKSKEGERVPCCRIINPMDAKGAVERWLKEYEAVMRETIMDQMSQSLRAYTQTSRAEWTQDWPGQVVLTVNQIHWTAGVQRAISKGKKGLQEFLQRSNEELQFIVMKVRGELTPLQRSTLGALVVIDVHARDVIEHLIAEDCSDISNFEWQSQMRYYYEQQDPAASTASTTPAASSVIRVRMINAVMDYGCEYLGNTDRLVITALTDRCYRTLMGALQLNLGGAPEGPAGTGKTETTKDLAKACAIQCVVFNCSDGLDYMAMGKFFKGLASSGAWSCFDEFNRIDLEVLSVVAQQIQTIQRAKEMRVESFVFEGTEIALKQRCAVFITMNPGYAGRSELPDNLKSQFRTVAMMIPDYGLIAQILLYSYGFVEAQSLSRKIVATYKLCSEQLSSQDHYDYGMRAVRAVLTAAQQLKQRFPREKESVLLLRSVTQVNEPKFLSHDIELFQGILSDLFPGVKPMQSEYGALLDAIHDNIRKMNLQPEANFINKILQLYETITVRHGLMLVGLPFSGKSSIYRVLAAALCDLAKSGAMNEQSVKTTIINPKSITSSQLYGHFDPISHEWSDGILARTFNLMASDTSPERKWLIFDGPVDAIWIENMNTVLDDNKKLCLMSGQIIHMTDSMNMIFEVRDLAVASPATVSRCGMVYCDVENVGWRPLMLSWLSTLPSGFDDKSRKRLENLFDWLVPPCLRVVRNNCHSYVPSSDSALVHNLMSIFDSLLNGMDSFDDSKKVEELGVVKVVALIEGLFLFSLVWSIGGCVDTDGRKQFDRFLREVCREVNFYKLSNQIPKKGLVYDYVFHREAQRWMHWSETLPTNYRIPIERSFQEILVPTLDSARYSFLLDTFIQARKPTLYVGPTGTGKSAYIHDTLDQLPKEKWDNIVIHFSAQTSANQTQALVDAKVDRRRRGVYGPSQGKQCVLFIDDLNMPRREKYFAQPPIELVRQLLDHGGWYNISEYQFHQIVDLQVVAAMGPPGGGRNPVTDRLLRHFNMVACTPFEDATVTHIFTSIMKWHWDRHPKFAPNVQALTDKLVTATRELYSIVTSKLLPTPAKTHYTYNLRDISRVFAGLCLSTPEHYDDPDTFIRLWLHETSRVFADRLTNDEDATTFLQGVKHILKTRFVMDFEKLMEPTVKAMEEAEATNKTKTNTAAPATTTTATQEGDGSSDGDQRSDQSSSSPAMNDLTKVRSLFFGDYMGRSRAKVGAAGGGGAPYVEIRDISSLYKVWQGYLDDYNVVTSKPMNLVLFRFAIEHLSRIARILKQPGGHALLVGVGGSGKQSLSRLAASVLEYDLLSIELTSTFGQEEWKNFLRKLLRKAGGEGKPTVFLFNDSQIKEDLFLENINEILNSGQVSNLYAADELAEVLELTRVEAKRLKKNIDGQQSLYNFFVAQCRSNLHVVLCMSPIGSSFRERLRMFPSLLSCCSLSWFSAWPEDALQSVASDFLTDVELDSATRSACVQMCQFFQKDVESMTHAYYEQLRRRCYVTPTSYLELLMTFKTLLESKRKEVSKLRARYQIGLDKLAMTETSVREMQIELEQMQPALLRTSQETDQMMQIVSKESEEAQKIRESVAKDERAATESANAAKAIERECQADLNEALPILEAAIAALDTLTTQEISEIKAMRNPPRGVKVVMEALCVVKKVNPIRVPDPSGSGKMVLDYWEPAKKSILSDPKLLRSLVEYDKDNIDPKVITKIRTSYLSNPEFSLDKISAVSRAAHSLASWIYAIEAYDRVVKQVKPKKEALQKAREEYDVVKQKLDAARGELAKVEGKINALQENLQKMQDEKAELEYKMEQCSIKLDRAHTLLSRLGGEKTRWTTLAEELGVAYTNLTGDILLSSGVIAYLPPFTSHFRSDAIGRWTSKLCSMSIPCSSDFSLARTLGDAVETRKWVIDGLPNDSFSIDNAIIMSRARRYPLLIDPQSQANKWIKNGEKEHSLVVIKASDDFTRTLENAIQFGYPVLIENVGEELDASLDGILSKHIFRKGNVRVIRFGDSDVEWNDSFRLFLTTKLPNPHYMPETQVKVTLLNMLITPEGLEDQLLGLVVAKEKPELESERNRLIVSSAANAAKLKEIEDKILQVLSSTAGNILDDSSAIEILSASKAISNEIEEKQKVAEKTEREIDVSRRGYQPVAAHASILFFAIADLASIDPMYQYSLGWFQKLFSAAIDAAEFSTVLSERIHHLNTFFRYSLYTHVCRSLFSKDRMLFSLLLTVRLLMSQGKVSSEEWRFLLTGGLALERQQPPNPAPSWLADRAWSELCRLSTTNESMRGLHNDFGAMSNEWQQVYDAPEPHRASFPGKFEEMDSFSKLLIIRCLRPDKVLPAARDFIIEHLGEAFTESPGFDLAALFADSATDVPIIFVLSPGSDPMSSLYKFAQDQKVSDRIASISLGQGQGPIAAKMIEKACKDGTWVVLQNAHLAPSWMPALERLCDGPLMKTQNAHPDFRLWITSYPSEFFPVAILQSSVKLTTESPSGLRQNLLDSFSKEPANDDVFFQSCRRSKALKNLTFGLAYFHAIIQQRKAYGSLGFNIPYAWNDSDFRISVRQLHMFLDEAPVLSLRNGDGEDDGIPYKALSYIIGEVNYGGRVTDDWDRRTLMAMLAQYINPEIHHPEYTLSASGAYALPSEGNHQEYIDYIKTTFPHHGEPALYGLHDNADITMHAAQTSALFQSLLLTEARSSSGRGGKETSKNAILADMAADILKRLPVRFDVEQVAAKYPVSYSESMNTVLVQECIRYNRLTDVIRSTLTNLRAALVGEVVMSRDLELLASSMFDGQIPDAWSSVSYPSLKPLSGYINDLLVRLKFLQEWIEHDVPTIVPLPSIYFTQSFLTGVLQNYARANKVAIDDVSFDFDFLDPQQLGAKPARPDYGAYISGLYLEGARWNFETGCLDESLPKQLFTPAPIIWLKPGRNESATAALSLATSGTGTAAASGATSLEASAAPSGTATPLPLSARSAAAAPVASVPSATSQLQPQAHPSKSLQRTVDVPVYRTTARRGVLSTTGHSTNFVMTIRLPTQQDPNHWVLRGTALVCSLDD